MTSPTMRERRAAEVALLPMEPASPPSDFVSGTFASIRAIWSYRTLLNLLLRRELKVRYKDSVLGFLWTLLRPLTQLLVYAIAIGQFLGASRGHDDYPIYVFAGLTIWQLFSEIVSTATGSILANQGLVKKVYLPREIFPLSVVGSAAFNFLMQVLILLGGTFIVGRPPRIENLGYAFLAVLIVLLYATGLALILSAVNVYLRDVQYIVEICLMWGMWTAPIVYHWSQVSPHLSDRPVLEAIFLANPVTEAVLGFQRAIWTRGTPADTIPNLATHMMWTALVGVGLLWVGQRLFSRLQGNFAQEL